MKSQKVSFCLEEWSSFIFNRNSGNNVVAVLRFLPCDSHSLISSYFGFVVNIIKDQDTHATTRLYLDPPVKTEGRITLYPDFYASLPS